MFINKSMLTIYIKKESIFKMISWAWSQYTSIHTHNKMKLNYCFHSTLSMKDLFILSNFLQCAFPKIPFPTFFIVGFPLIL